MVVQWDSICLEEKEYAKEHMLGNIGKIGQEQ